MTWARLKIMLYFWCLTKPVGIPATSSVFPKVLNSFSYPPTRQNYNLLNVFGTSPMNPLPTVCLTPSLTYKKFSLNAVLTCVPNLTSSPNTRSFTGGLCLSSGFNRSRYQTAHATHPRRTHTERTGFGRGEQRAAGRRKLTERKVEQRVDFGVRQRVTVKRIGGSVIVSQAVAATGDDGTVFIYDNRSYRKRTLTVTLPSQLETHSPRLRKAFPERHTLAYPHGDDSRCFRRGQDFSRHQARVTQLEVSPRVRFAAPLGEPVRFRREIVEHHRSADSKGLHDLSCSGIFGLAHIYKHELKRAVG